MRPHGSSAELERRRLRALALKEQGLKPTEIARRLGTSLRSLERWMDAYHQKGPEGLKAKPSPGRHRKLSPRQRQALAHALLKGATACGFSTDLWTCRRIAQLIRERYGVTYHVCALPRVLASLGFSPSKAAVSAQRAG